jgi:hypothetical protein
MPCAIVCTHAGFSAFRGAYGRGSAGEAARLTVHRQDVAQPQAVGRQRARP